MSGPDLTLELYAQVLADAVLDGPASAEALSTRNLARQTAGTVTGPCVRISFDDIILGDTLGPTGAQLPKADVLLTNPQFGTKKGGGGTTGSSPWGSSFDLWKSSAPIVEEHRGGVTTFEK